MRNLKRALSLALASVMLLGMMVVGTSAASYPDVDESKHHVEAIDVLNAVEVMIGDAGTGNFRPDDKVSRNEMAVIMAKLVLGTYEADSYAGAHPFTDVPEWADRYVAACYTNGIIAGRSADTYDGSATVTAVEAAAMMLRALGYEDLSLGAAQWDQPVAAKANEVELFKGMSGNSKAEMSRDAVAQLSLNALKTTMVTTSKGTDITMSDGTTFYAARSYNKVTSSADWATAIDNFEDEQGRSYVELGEKLYDGKLTLSDGTDSFGRPCDEWEYKGRTVTAAEDYSVVFTAKQSKGDVEKALKNYKIVTTKAEGETKKVTKGMTDTGVVSADSIQTINGASATAFNSGAKSAAEAIADLTTNSASGKDANGYAVEIYANGSREITKIVVLKYDVATVKSISESKDGDYRKTNYSFDNGIGSGYVYTDPDKDSKVVLHSDVEKDDTVIALKLADEIHVWLAETMTGTQTSYNSGKKTIVVDGKTYDVAVAMEHVAMTSFETNSDDEATFYLDLYGNVVKSEGITSKDYAVIDAIRWTNDSNSLDKGHATARLIFTDGTTKEVTLNEMTNGTVTKGFAISDSDGSNAGVLATSGNGNAAHKVSSKEPNYTNRAAHDMYVGLIVTYSVKSDGKYDLTVKGTAPVTSTSAETYTTNGVPTTHGVSGNSKTIYIVRSMKAGNDEADSYDVYTGYENVPTITTSTDYSVFSSYVDGYAKYVFVSALATAVDTSKSSDLLYIFDAANHGNDKDKNYTFSPYVLNGEKLEDSITVNGASAKINITSGGDGLYQVKLDKDGKVTEATKITTATINSEKWIVGTVSADAADGAVKVGTTSYGYTDAKVYSIDLDDNVVELDGDCDASKGYQAYIKMKGTSAPDDSKVELMYVVQKEGAAQIITPEDNTAAKVEAILGSEGKAELPEGITLPDNVNVKNNETLVLQGDANVGTGLTIKNGGKIEVNGNVTGTITTEAGGKVEIKGDVEMPKVTGNGTVEVPSGVTAGAVSSATTPDQYITDLTNKGLVNTPEKTDKKNESNVLTGVEYAVTANNTVGVMGGGKVESWSSEVTIAQAAARTGGDANSKVIFVKLDLTSFADDQKHVKIEYVKGEGSAKQYGTPETHGNLKIADIKDGSASTCTIPVTSDVTKVILTLVD